MPRAYYAPADWRDESEDLDDLHANPHPGAERSSPVLVTQRAPMPSAVTFNRCPVCNGVFSLVECECCEDVGYIGLPQTAVSAGAVTTTAPSVHPVRTTSTQPARRRWQRSAFQFPPCVSRHHMQAHAPTPCHDAEDMGTATAGYRGTAKSGDAGVVAIQWWDEDTNRYRVAIGYVGEDGIKKNTIYKVEDGRLIEAEKPS